MTTIRQAKRARSLETALKKGKCTHLLPATEQARMSAPKAFESMTARVLWLNKKIEESRGSEGRYEFYVRERDAIFWMMDKIRSLSRKLLELEGKSQQ